LSTISTSNILNIVCSSFTSLFDTQCPRVSRVRSSVANDTYSPCTVDDADSVDEEILPTETKPEDDDPDKDEVNGELPLPVKAEDPADPDHVEERESSAEPNEGDDDEEGDEDEDEYA
jgi:hypothetical protein